MLMGTLQYRDELNAPEDETNDEYEDIVS